MNDIMIDFETLGTKSNSVVLSLGAIRCNLITGEIGETFYRVLDLQDQIENYNRVIDGSTITWWMEQTDGARQAFSIPGKVLLADMCESFNKFTTARDRLWGNGASFDNAILRDIFSNVKINMNIPFWQDRDMRTILGFYPKQLQEVWKKENLRVGTYHNAIDDCKHQIKYCSHILQELGVQELH